MQMNTKGALLISSVIALIAAINGCGKKTPDTTINNTQPELGSDQDQVHLTLSHISLTLLPQTDYEVDQYLSLKFTQSFRVTLSPIISGKSISAETNFRLKISLLDGNRNERNLTKRHVISFSELDTKISKNGLMILDIPLRYGYDSLGFRNGANEILVQLDDDIIYSGFMSRGDFSGSIPLLPANFTNMPATEIMNTIKDTAENNGKNLNTIGPTQKEYAKHFNLDEQTADLLQSSGLDTAKASSLCSHFFIIPLKTNESKHKPRTTAVSTLAPRTNNPALDKFDQLNALTKDPHNECLQNTARFLRQVPIDFVTAINDSKPEILTQDSHIASLQISAGNSTITSSSKGWGNWQSFTESDTLSAGLTTTATGGFSSGGNSIGIGASGGYSHSWSWATQTFSMYQLSIAENKTNNNSINISRNIAIDDITLKVDAELRSCIVISLQPQVIKDFALALEWDLPGTMLRSKARPILMCNRNTHSKKISESYLYASEIGAGTSSIFKNASGGDQQGACLVMRGANRIKAFKKTLLNSSATQLALSKNQNNLPGTLTTIFDHYRNQDFPGLVSPQ